MIDLSEKYKPFILSTPLLVWLEFFKVKKLGQRSVKRRREWEGRNWKKSSLIRFLLRVAEKWNCSLGKRGKDISPQGFVLDGLTILQELSNFGVGNDVGKKRGYDF